MDRCPLPPELYRRDTDDVLSTYEKIGGKVYDPVDQGGGGNPEADLGSFRGGSRKGGNCHDIIIVVGRKAEVQDDFQARDELPSGLGTLG